MNIRFFLLVPALALAGCAGTYQQAPASGHTATLVIQRAENGLRHSGNQAYLAVADAQCGKVAGSGNLAIKSFLSPDDTSVRLAADNRFFMRVETFGVGQIHFDSAQSSIELMHGKAVNVTRYKIDTPSCVNLVSFVPENGHTYEVSHIMASDGCFVRLLDKSTGDVPSSYELSQPPASCFPLY